MDFLYRGRIRRGAKLDEHRKGCVVIRDLGTTHIKMRTSTSRLHTTSSSTGKSSPDSSLPAIKSALGSSGTAVAESTGRGSRHAHFSLNQMTMDAIKGIQLDESTSTTDEQPEPLAIPTLLTQHPLHAAHQLLSNHHASSSSQTDQTEVLPIKLIQDNLDLLITESRNTKERVETDYHVQLQATKQELIDRFRGMIDQQRSRQVEHENQIRLANEQKTANRLALLRQELKVKHEAVVRKIMEDIEAMKRDFEAERVKELHERMRLNEIIYRLKGVIQRQIATMRTHQVPAEEMLELDDVPDVIETLQAEVKEREKQIKQLNEQREQDKEDHRLEMERREQHHIKEKADLQRIIEGSDEESDVRRALAAKNLQEERELEIALIKKELEQDKQHALSEQRQQFEQKLQELRDEQKNEKLKMKLDLNKLQKNYEKRVQLLQESVSSVTGLPVPSAAVDLGVGRSKTAASSASRAPRSITAVSTANSGQTPTPIIDIMDRQEGVLKYSALFFGQLPTDSGSQPRKHQGKRYISN